MREKIQILLDKAAKGDPMTQRPAKCDLQIVKYLLHVKHFSRNNPPKRHLVWLISASQKSAFSDFLNGTKCTIILSTVRDIKALAPLSRYPVHLKCLSLPILLRETAKAYLQSNPKKGFVYYRRSKQHKESVPKRRTDL